MIPKYYLTGVNEARTSSRDAQASVAGSAGRRNPS